MQNKITLYNSMLMASIIILTGCGGSTPNVSNTSYDKNSEKTAKQINEQDNQTQKKFRTEKTFYNDGKLKFVINYENGRETTKTGYTYDEKGVLKKETQYINGIKNGIEKWYYTDGSLLSEASYKNGLKEGKYTMYLGGKKFIVSYFSNDLNDGLLSIFDKNGNITSQTKYEKGIEVEVKEFVYFENGDIEIERTFINNQLTIAKSYNSDGLLILTVEDTDKNDTQLVKEYYSNGSVSRSYEFKSNDKEKKFNGEYKEFWENGNIKSFVIYKDGIRNGPVKGYFENGNIEFSGNLLNNIINGEATSFYKNGKLKSIETYRDNLRHGNSKYYYESGELNSIYNYIKDKRQGLSRSYFENGNLKWERKDDAGNIISYKELTKSGRIIDDLTFKNDKKTGTTNQYFDSGELSWEFTYKNGLTTSAFQYYKGGNLAAEYFLKNGKANYGYKYTFEGKKSKLTKAHFANAGFDY